MFDFQATIRWVTEVLKDPAAAALAYRETSAGWQQSFLQLTLPVYAAAFLVGLIVALVTGGTFLYGSLSAGVFIFSLLWSLAWTFVIAFIFDFLAGVFDGKRGFDAAYSVVALAIIPSALGTAIGPLPWFGWLISLAAGIYSLVLAYRFLPVFLEIPDASRMKHYVVSIIVALVVNIVVAATLGSMFAPSLTQRAVFDDPTESVSSGLFGGFERQASLAEAAAKDTFDPPADGRLSDRQVENYADTLRKTQMFQDRLGKSLQGMEDEEPSLTDIFDGVGDAIRLSTAEMEVVKTAGGNWAEHQWVKGQIETARIQQDLNDTTEYNYRLFQRYEAEITPFD